MRRRQRRRRRCRRPRLTEAEFLEQGNAICAEGNAAIDAGAEALGTDGPPDAATLTAFFTDTILPSVQGQLDGLRALSPPEELEADIDALLEDADAALDDMRQQIEDDAEAFLDAPDPFEEVNARAVELGLTACGESEG